MKTTTSHLLQHALTLATMAALVACADNAPLSPARTPDASLAALLAPKAPGPLAILERATVRYKNLNNAIADGFLLLHDCEVRPGEGPVGTVYYHPTRLLDGLVDPASPDALIYEPGIEGHPKLVGVEFAVPYPLAPTPPTFLGNTFQAEDEFGVFALHVWIWRKNPNGMFAESNPRVSCGEDR